MQTNLTKIVLLQVWATLVFSSWAFGEKVLWGPKWIGIVALTSVVPCKWRSKSAAEKIADEKCNTLQTRRNVHGSRKMDANKNKSNT